MPIILLVFVNYARFSKKKNAEIMFLTFYFKFGKKKHTHTSMLHLQVNDKLIYPVYIKKTFWVLNSLSEKYKNSNNKQPTRGRHPR